MTETTGTATAEITPLNPPSRSAGRWIEMGVLFVGVPVAFALWRSSPAFVSDVALRWGATEATANVLHPRTFMFPTLFGFTVVCLLMLLFSKTFRKRELWNAAGLGQEFRRIMLIAIPMFALIGVYTWAFARGGPLESWLLDRGWWWALHPDQVTLFRLPRQIPLLWLVIMCVYPVFSVWPQEVVYRSFFHHRYAGILRTPMARIWVGGFIFGLMHIVFLNVVAPLMCFAGGVLFAWTYERSRSLLAATFEHAIYGCWVFTIGIGWYFFGGSTG